MISCSPLRTTVAPPVLRCEPVAGPLQQDATLYVVPDGTILRGNLSCKSLLIHEGSTVWVDQDLHLMASGTVRIEGTLVASDGDGPLHPHAAAITISSPYLIDVPGSIRGGRGWTADAAHKHGGNGSSIRLSAPIVCVDGVATAGAGGDGTAGGRGGNGGAATVEGYLLVREGDSHSSLVSGAGGVGSYPSDSGESGHVIAQVPAEVVANWDTILPQILALTEAHPLFREDTR